MTSHLLEFDELLEEAVERGEGKAIRLLGVHIGLNEQSDDVFKQLELFSSIENDIHHNMMK